MLEARLEREPNDPEPFHVDNGEVEQLDEAQGQADKNEFGCWSAGLIGCRSPKLIGCRSAGADAASDFMVGDIAVLDNSVGKRFQKREAHVAKVTPIC